MPKYIVFGTADEFFVPDTPRNFMPIMAAQGGETHLRMAPNFDHPMLPLPFIIINNIMAFVDAVIRDVPRPTLQEELVYSNETGAFPALATRVPLTAL